MVFTEMTAGTRDFVFEDDINGKAPGRVAGCRDVSKGLDHWDRFHFHHRSKRVLPEKTGNTGRIPV